MSEIWKDINGFPGYQVSNQGRIRTLDRYVWNKSNGSNSLLKGMIHKLDTTGKEYAQIGVWVDGKCKKYLVHRLVAEYFVHNPDNLPEVNHEDRNKLNNNDWNLRWVTRLGNMQHLKSTGGYKNFPNGSNKSNSILTDEAVRHIRRKELRNIEYCKMYGVKPSTISCLWSDKYGKRWAHV